MTPPTIEFVSLHFRHWLEICQMVTQSGQENFYEAHQRFDIYNRAIKKGLSQENALIVAKRFQKKRLPRVIFQSRGSEKC